MEKSFIIDTNAVQNAKTEDEKMIMLNDYLYSGDTVFRILKKYSGDLKRVAEEKNSEVDLLHYHFLLQIMELLEHNDFLTAQSQKIREFYQYMAKQYPYLSFTFKGRIKSLIRAEAKFNGYIVEHVYNYYLKNHAYPPVEELKERLTRFRDLIAYRIVISMPKCHVRDAMEREQEEIRHLYEIANVLKVFLEARRDVIPVGECIYFDEAYERGMKLQQLELSKLDVNMFAAIDNSLINDGCGLYRGRLILPYEHLSRFQND